MGDEQSLFLPLDSVQLSSYISTVQFITISRDKLLCASASGRMAYPSKLNFDTFAMRSMAVEELNK